MIANKNVSALISALQCTYPTVREAALRVLHDAESMTLTRVERARYLGISEAGYRRIRALVRLLGL